MRSPFRSRSDAFAWLGVGLAVALALVLTAHRIFVSPTGRVILDDPMAPWIEAPPPFSTNTRQWGRTRVPTTSFTRAFGLSVSTEAELSIRAFGRFEVRLNERVLPFDGEPASWKRPQRIEIGEWLHAGENTLIVDVQNREGPALLSLRLATRDGPGDARAGALVTSDEQWLSSLAGRPPVPARFATDLAAHPQAGRVATPSVVFARRWPGLLGLFAASAAAFWAAARYGRRGASASSCEQRAGAPRAWLGEAVVIGMWCWLLFAKFGAIPLRYGFDAMAHLDYLRILVEQGRIPIATDGWSTYHPPLYYMLVAAAQACGQLFGPSVGAFFAKLPGFVAGLGIALLSGRVARRVWPDRALPPLIALSFACVLPMNVYLAGYLTNESMLGLWSACAILATIDVLLDERPRIRSLALLSTCLGLALLSKFTGLIVVVVVLAFVGPKLATVAARDRSSGWRPWLALVAPALIIAGWFYARNVALFGTPLVGNWNLPGEGQTWWSHPGFHTPDYYLGFGQSLVHPFFSAFASFWDALYSTMWGDGLLSGAADLEGRNPAWRYDWMSLGYLMAFPVTLGVVAGFGGMLHAALRETNAGRRAVFGFLAALIAATLFMIFYATLALPYHGQAKAFYGLAVAPALAVGFALAYERIDRALGTRGGVAARSILLAWWLTSASVFYLAYAA